MPTIINGLTGIDKIQSGAIDVSDVPDGVITLAKLAPSGTSGQVLTSAGTGSAPVWGNLPASGIGVGQTWTTFNTTTRVPGTTYTNSTGKPIIFCYSANSGGTSGTFNMTVNGVTVATPGWGSSVTSGIFVSIVIPNGGTYSYTQGGYTAGTVTIAELR